MEVRQTWLVLTGPQESGKEGGFRWWRERRGHRRRNLAELSPGMWVRVLHLHFLPDLPTSLPLLFLPSIPSLSKDLEYLSAETSFRGIYSYNCEKYLLQIHLN